MRQACKLLTLKVGVNMYKIKNSPIIQKTISKAKEKIRGKLHQRRMRRKFSIAPIVKRMGMMKSIFGSYTQS